MSVIAGTHYCSKSKVEIISFDPENGEASEHELSQVRSLFVDGMTINNAPEKYINQSLQSDLKDVQSMSATYLSGRGAFFLLSESDDGNDDAVITPSSNKHVKGNQDNSSKRRRSIQGMVGLQDVSATTGTVGKRVSTEGDPQNAEGKVENSNICELRRMSIHSTSRRRGYGVELVQACISHAKRNNFDGIKLYTGGWMEVAINFYIKLGFEDRGRLEYKHNDGSASIIAHLELIF